MSDNFPYFRARPRKRFQAPGLQTNVLRFLLSTVLLATCTAALDAATVTWDAGTDNQWSGSGDATSWGGETYNDGDTAQFLGDGAGTVDITATVSPESITVNAETNYLFSGEGSIASGALTKAGSGMLTLSGNHSYTGTTSIAAGMLVVQSRYSLGTTNGATTVASGATLELNHAPTNNVSPIEENLTLNGAGVSGTEGALKVTATGAGAELSSTVTLGSDATINTQVRFDMGGTITDNGNGYTLTKMGSDYADFMNTTGVTADYMHLVVAEGDLWAGNNSLPGGTGTTVNVASGALLTTHGSQTITNSPNIYFADGSTFRPKRANDTMSINGTMTLNGAVTFNGPDATHTANISSTIGGTGSLTKAGPNTTTLAGANDYTGATTINSGTLKAQSQTALGTTNGTTTVANGATLELNYVPPDNNSPIMEHVFIQGAGANGTGAIKNTGSGPGAEMSGMITLVSNATINTLARMDTVSTITDNGNGYTLTKIGSNYNNFLSFGGVADYSHLIIAEGDFWANRDSALPGGTGTTVRVADGARLTIWGSHIITNAPAITFATNSIFRTARGGRYNAYINGTMTLEGPVTFDGVRLDSTGTVESDIGGPGYPIKIGENTMIFTGDNDYAGNTVVARGTIQFATIADRGENCALGAGSMISLDDSDQELNSYIENIGTGGSTDRTLIFGTPGASNLYSGTVGIANSGTGPLYFSGSFSNYVHTGFTNTLVLSGSNTNGVSTISTVLRDGVGGGSLAIQKNGLSTWILSTTNTYSGTTTVNDGTLRLQYGGMQTLDGSERDPAINGGVLDIAEGTHLTLPSAVTNFTIAAGGRLHVGGGSFHQDLLQANATVASVTKGGGTVSISGGELLLTNGLDFTVLDFENSLEISGGDVHVQARAIMQNNLKTIGSGATINFDSLYMNGEISWMLGPAGISPLQCAGVTELTNAVITVDGAAYGGAGTSLVLLDCGSLVNTSQVVNVTGFDPRFYSATVIQDQVQNQVRVDINYTPSASIYLY